MSELVLRNRQRVRAVDLRPLRRLARTLLEEVLGLGHYELGVHLVAAPEMRRLNEQFLQHAGSTDVITFDHSAEASATRRSSTAKRVPVDVRRLTRMRNAERGVRNTRRNAGATEGPTLHGEVFICLDDAVAQARRFGVAWTAEVSRYLVHGLLHLLGHDDHDPVARRRMKREEDRLVRDLARRFRLSQLSHQPKVHP